MLKKVLIALFLFLYCTVNGYSHPIDSYKMMTEEYPPYNFTEKGKIKGISSEIVNEVLKRMGAKTRIGDFKVLPWARAYAMTQKQMKTLLFSTTVTDARKKIFKFATPLVETNIVLHAKKSKNITINSPEDLKKYKIGVIRDDIGQLLLEDLGITNVQKVAKADENVQKLKNDRIDLWAYGDNVGRWFIKKRDNVKLYEVVYTLKKGYLGVAFHKDTPDSIVNAFQGELDKFRATRKYKKILEKYAN